MSLIANNQSDIGWSSIVTTTEFAKTGAGRMFVPNFSDLFRAKENRLFSTYTATFHRAVAHVVGLSTKEQMARVHTGSVIAAMQNAHSGRYWTNMNSPRNAVGFQFFPAPLSGNHPVSELVETPSPHPAGISMPYPEIFLEPHIQRFISWHVPLYHSHAQKGGV